MDIRDSFGEEPWEWTLIEIEELGPRDHFMMVNVNENQLLIIGGLNQDPKIRSVQFTHDAVLFDVEEMKVVKKIKDPYMGFTCTRN